MAQQLTDSELNQLFELFVLLSKKNTFTIEEYGDVHIIYTKLKKYMLALQNPNETPDALEFSKVEVDYLANLITVSTDRVALGINFYESIVSLFKRLSEIQKLLQPPAVVEDTSSEEQITQLE